MAKQTLESILGPRDFEAYNLLKNNICLVLSRFSHPRQSEKIFVLICNMSRELVQCQGSSK